MYHTVSRGNVMLVHWSDASKKAHIGLLYYVSIYISLYSSYVSISIEE